MFSGRFSPHRRTARIAACVLACAPVTRAATSGTWIPTYATVPWGTPSRWAGAVPDAGGTATFPENLALTASGFYFTDPLVTSTYTLSQLSFDSAAPYYLSASASGLLSLSSTGATLAVTRSQLSSPTVAAFGDYLAVPLGGGGALTRTGPGAITLFATNTYLGGTKLTAGTLFVGAGDAALGNTSGSIQITNAALGTLISSFATARPLAVSGTATFPVFTTTTFGGPLSGSGTVVKPYLSNGLLIFTASNAFSGAIQSLNGALQLSASGSFNAVSNLEIAGQLNLDDTAINNTDRIANAAVVFFHGSELRLTNTGSGTTSTETFATLSLDTGLNLITLANDPSAAAGFSLTHLTRSNHATLFVRGNAFTGASGSTNATVAVSTSPGTLFGGGGTGGTPTTSVIPWTIGTTSGATASLNVGASFLTYAAGRLRSLDLTTEYAFAFSALAPTANVRLPAGTVTSAPSGGTTVNVLALSGNDTLNGPDGVTVTAGGLLAFGPGGNTVAAPLSFGGQEAVLHVQTTLTQSAPLSGTGGLTKSGPATLALVSAGALSTYTGQTTIVDGTLQTTGDLPNDGSTPSALGKSTTPIILNGGSFTGNIARLWFASDTVIDRAISVTGSGANLVGLGTANGSETVTLTGPLRLDRILTLEFSPTPTATFTGQISGTGALAESNGSSQNLTASNTFSGGLSLLFGRFAAGNNSAFGTGTIYSEDAFDDGAGHPFLWGTIAASGTDTRTLANPVQLNSGLTLDGANNPLVLTGRFDFNGYIRTVAASGSVTLAGPLVNGGLVYLGDGTLVLASNANTYNSGTTVLGGTLQVGDGATNGFLGTTVLAQVQDPGTLAIRRSDAVQFGNNALAGTGTFAQTGSGITFIVGTQSLTGAVAVTNGQLVIGTGNTTGTLGNPAAYTIASPGTLTFWRSDTVTISATFGGNGTLEHLGPGTLTLTGALAYTGNTLVDGGGRLVISTPLRPVTGSLTVTDASTTFLAAPASATHTIVGEFAAITAINGTVALTSSNRPTLAGSLLIANTLSLTSAQLQLLNNDALFHNASEYDLVSYVAAGLITSSGTSAAHTGLAVVPNANGRGGPLFPTFDNVPAIPTDVLVKFTYVGDTDLNGIVDASDLANLLAGLNGTLAGYANGDLNYDGIVNTTDLALLVGSLASQGAPLGDSAGGGSVPEPDRLTFALPLAAWAVRRRARSHSFRPKIEMSHALHRI